MIVIKVCETKKDFAVAADLTAELGAWDSAETEKFGFSPQSVLDFYYVADSEVPEASLAGSSLTLLGHVESEAAGCIAYRRVKPAICEMKRLYVRPRYRGTGLGRALVLSLIAQARGAGFERMRLETVSFMSAAVRMYKEMGFVVRSPYYDIPEAFLPITIFMEKNLNDTSGSALSTGLMG